MRKLFCVLLALAIACSLSAFAEPLPETETQEAQEAKLTRMLPVLDGLARVMGPSGNTVYAADDPGFVWAQLYQAAMAQRAGAEGDEVLSVPAETMRTYAAASFAGMTDLPPIPEPEEGEAPFIVYDAEADAYLLTRQDARQIYSVVERYSALDAGILAGIGLYERSYDYRLCGFTCLLTENRAASAAPGSADAEAQAELSAATEAAEAPAETAGADLTDQTPEAETPEAAATEPEETAETEAAPETETVPETETIPEAETAEAESTETATGETAGEGAPQEGEATAADAATAADETTEAPLSFPCAVVIFRAEGDDDFFGLDSHSCYLRLEEPREMLIEEVLLPFNSLSWGSSGTEVASLQRRLEALGYHCGGENGAFGAGTLRALRYFQEALGVPQDGIATVELQNRLFSEEAPAYNPYLNVRLGASGVRVEELQSRLRELGYEGKPVDGQFDARTESAVKLFQQTAGLSADGIAGQMTLTALAADDAPVCAEFIALYRGDTGLRVTEMQEQLISLEMMDGWASGTYDEKTDAAVRAFIAAKGIAETVDQGVSAETVFRMFNPDAPDASAAATETTPETDATPAGAPGETVEADVQPSDAAGGTETPDSLESETPSGI